MAKNWYVYTFEDGYAVTCMGMSKLELSHEIIKHGKLISKTIAQ